MSHIFDTNPVSFYYIVTNMKNKIISIITVILIIIIGTVLFTNSNDNKLLAVGAILPLTGPAQFFGEEMKKGMDLANQDTKINLVYEDSQSNTNSAISAYQKLKSQNNLGAVILSLSSVANTVVPMAEKDGVFSMQTLVSARKVQGDLSIRYFTSAEQEAPIMANFATRSLNLKKISLLVSNDGYGKTYGEVFKEVVEKEGVSIVDIEEFDKKDQDFKTQITKIKNSETEGVYIIGLDNQLVNILKQMKEMNFDKIKMTNWVLSSQTVQEKAGGLAEGVYLTTPEYYLSGNQKVKDFSDAYENKYKTKPSAYSAIGYDLTGIYSQAIKGANNSKEVFNNLKNVKDFDGLMGKLNVNEKGEITFPLFPAKIENGVMALIK